MTELKKATTHEGQALLDKLEGIDPNDYAAVYTALNPGESTYTMSHGEIEALLGPACMVPGYVTGELGGGWSLQESTIPMARGYFSSVIPCNRNPVLSLNGMVYMSVTPMELESHWLPLHEAHGNVVVAGLGMAMIVVNMLHWGNCANIVVLEHSQELINAYPDILEGYTRDLWIDALDDGVLTVVKADCRGELPLDEIATGFGAPEFREGLVNHLYADIWPVLGCENALPDTQHMCEQLKPIGCTYWGQELEIAAQIGAPSEGPFATPTELRSAIAKMKLPLSVLEWDDHLLEQYSRLVSAAAYATVMR